MIDILKDIDKDACAWSREKAWDWFNKRPLIIGFNYLPQTAVNSVEMWQSSSFDIVTIEKELRWASEYGYNCVRVFLPYVVFLEEQTAFLKNLDDFLSAAKNCGLMTMPVIFDDCSTGIQPSVGAQPKPGTGHNGCWVSSPGARYIDDLTCYPNLERYVKTIVSRYGADERVLMWDVFNEPGNFMRGAKSLYLAEKAFKWAREAQPVQPLTAAVWSMDAQIGVPDTAFVERRILELSDVVSFHQYADKDKTVRTIENLEKTGYPLICSEWMARTFDNDICEILPVFCGERIGSLHWGLCRGKSQTYLPWGWNKDRDGEPPVWFHDVLSSDGKPYSEREMQLVKSYSQDGR